MPELTPTEITIARIRAQFRAEAFREAAKEVESHWNSYSDTCNQKAQAARSAEVLRGMAKTEAAKVSAIS